MESIVTGLVDVGGECVAKGGDVGALFDHLPFDIDVLMQLSSSSSLVGVDDCHLDSVGLIDSGDGGGGGDDSHCVGSFLGVGAAGDASFDNSCIVADASGDPDRGAGGLSYHCDSSVSGAAEAALLPPFCCAADVDAQRNKMAYGALQPAQLAVDACQRSSSPTEHQMAVPATTIIITADASHNRRTGVTIDSKNRRRWRPCDSSTSPIPPPRKRSVSDSHTSSSSCSITTVSLSASDLSSSNDCEAVSSVTSSSAAGQLVSSAKLSAPSDTAAKRHHCPHPGCQLSFSRHYRLKVHLRSHTEQRPFTCEEPGCLASFYEKSKLNRHKQQHSEARHQCGVCAAKFRQLSNLRRHEATVHNSNNSNSGGCAGGSDTGRPHSLPPSCGPLSPAGRSSAQQQQQCGHSKPESTRFQCVECGRSFARARLLTLHQSAAAAGRCRLRRTASSASAAGDGDKTFRCLRQNCGWSFASLAKLRRHQTQHSQRQDFVCPLAACGRRYRRLEYLVQHVRRTHGLLALRGQTPLSPLSPTHEPPQYFADEIGQSHAAAAAADVFPAAGISADCALPIDSFLTSAVCPPESSSGIISKEQVDNTKALGECLRALGVGRVPCYLHCTVAGGRGPLCSRTDLVYCGSARHTASSATTATLFPPPSDTLHSVPSAAGAGAEGAHLAPSSNVSRHKRRGSRRHWAPCGPTSGANPGASWSQHQQQLSESHSTASTTGAIFAMDHVFPEDNDVFLSSMPLFDEDPFRTVDSTALPSTINLNDLA